VTLGRRRSYVAFCVNCEYVFGDGELAVKCDVGGRVKYYCLGCFVDAKGNLMFDL